MNGNVNINDLMHTLSSLLLSLPKFAPALLALILTVRLLRDIATGWKKAVDLPSAQVFAWYSAGLAALAYAGMKF